MERSRLSFQDPYGLSISNTSIEQRSIPTGIISSSPIQIGPQQPATSPGSCRKRFANFTATGVKANPTIAHLAASNPAS